MDRIDIYHPQQRKNRVLSTVSLTVPDQTLSMRTILDRYARGIPIESPVANPYYNEDPENPSTQIPLGENYKNLDLTDKQAIRDSIVAELEEISTKVSKERQNAKKEALRKELEKELEEKNKNLVTDQPPPEGN